MRVYRFNFPLVQKLFALLHVYKPYGATWEGKIPSVYHHFSFHFLEHYYLSRLTGTKTPTSAQQ